MEVNNVGLEEIWKPVPEFEGYYEVSNLGRIRSLDRITSDGKKIKGKLLSSENSDRYWCKTLWKDGKEMNVILHRLVANAFVSNPDNLPQVNHIDGNTHNNCANNLEWVSASGNIQHAITTGLRQNEYSKEVKCLDTGEVFISISAAARSVDTDTTRLSEAIFSKSCCKGLTFIYPGTVDDEEGYLAQARAKYQGWHKRPKMPNSCPIIFIETGQEFDSLKSAGRALGCDPMTIKSHCQSGKPYKTIHMKFKEV